jgi:hypothetical protein
MLYVNADGIAESNVLTLGAVMVMVKKASNRLVSFALPER